MRPQGRSGVWPVVRALMCLLLAGLGAGWHGVPRAQSYPAKPVRLIVPYAGGTSTDLLARMLVPRKIGRAHV